MKFMRARLLFFLCLAMLLLPVSNSLAWMQTETLDSLFENFSSQDTLTRAQNTDTTPTLVDFIKKGKRYTIQANEIKLEVNKPLDSVEVSEHISRVNVLLDTLQTRIQSPTKNFNLRYINALSWIVDNLQVQNEEFESEIDLRMNNLIRVDSILNAIKNDPFLEYDLKESSLIPAYSESIQNLKSNLASLDSTVYSQELITARFQSELNKISISLLNLEEYIASNRKTLEATLFQKEINYLWQENTISSPKPILQVSRESFRLNLTLLYNYFQNQIGKVTICLILIGVSYWGMKKTISEIKSQKEYGKLILERIRFFAKEPFAATMVSLLPLLIFLFERPTLPFFTFMLVLQAFFTTILIFRNYQKRSLFYWMLMILLFLVFSMSNLYWELIYQERIYILIASILALYIGGFQSRKFQSENSKDKRFLNQVSIFMVSLLSISILVNIFGRFSLSKIISVAAVSGFVQAISLYFFIVVIMEGIYLLIESSKKESDTFTSFFDFQGIQNRLRGTFLFLAFFLWIYSFLQNTALFEVVFDQTGLFLSKERFLGSNSFTFGSILLFAVILYVSLKIANTVVYFATIKDEQNTTRTKRLGSSILIIRLVLITVGFFIATAAADIPLTNVTIVLGALSVGIGFGLQTIINNLVSGVILAFERPIQIGDEIEVGMNSGTVKEVGIRASKIRAYDGSEIIVPNGDLLSQSLVNWTLSDRRRRIELMIGVAYDSDMKKVKSILEKVLDREEILKVPVAKVLMESFGESSVDFRLLFWVETMDIWIEIRSVIMTAIFESFEENNIEIPYPKRDLYLKTVPSAAAEKGSTPIENQEENSEKDQKKFPEA